MYYLRFHITILVLVLTVVTLSQSATTHKHGHTINKERAEDGSYAGRDSHHLSGGEHHTEFDHEAILGSVKEAEEFDSLSPEESKRRLAILVKKIDMDHDGRITRNELHAWILRSFKMLSEEEAVERFSEIDNNGDGRIEWAEYLDDNFGMDQEDGRKEYIEAEQSEDEKKMIVDDQEMFNASDLNQDGWLNNEEFVLFTSPEEHPQMLPIILAQTLRDKDINNDGKIDFQEFVGDSGANHDKEWLVAEKEKFDQDYDKDGDGTLNGNEILSWVVPSNDEIASDEVSHLFASADDDHDDNLAYEEIIKNYDVFVGSEATDYGDHLHNIHQFEDEL